MVYKKKISPRDSFFQKDVTESSIKRKLFVFTVYLKSFASYIRYRILFFVFLSIVASIGQGIGIFMLIPVIRLISDGHVSAGNSNFITDWLLKLFFYFNLPFTLGTFLFFYFILTAFLKYANYKQNVLNMTMQNGFTSLLRCRLFNSIVLSEWSFISRQKSSNIAHVLTSDIPRVATGTFFFLKGMIGIIFTLSYLAWALILSAKLTAIIVIIFVLVFFILKSYFPEAFSRNVKARNALSGIYTLLLDHLNGLKVAKSYCMEKKECEEFEKLSDNISATSIHSSIIASRTTMVFTILSTLFLCLFLYLAYYVFLIPIDSLIVISLVFSRLIPGFMELQNNAQQTIGMLPSFLAMNELIDKFELNREMITESSSSASKFRLEKSISLNDVSFAYESDSTRTFEINNLSLEIPAGKISAIIGHSGSGKSTLADLISGMLKPDSGNIMIDGIDLNRENLYQWKQKVGYMPQDMFLFHDTIRNNILRGKPDASDEEIYEVLKLASAYELVMSLPEKLDTVIRDRGVRLSGGERQRISLARTLLRNPLLLILDEATNALDTANEEKILTDLKKLRGKYTVIIISHKPTIISYADKVIKIKQGQLEPLGIIK